METNVRLPILLGCGIMKATFQLKPGVTWGEASIILTEVIKRQEKIEWDIHTNKYYELYKGRIWHKGNGTGKAWELLCNSREAHSKAWEMMRT